MAALENMMNLEMIREDSPPKWMGKKKKKEKQKNETYTQTSLMEEPGDR